MDVFMGEIFFENYFQFKDTQPVNGRFEFFGVGDQNFLNNSGSYIIIILGLFVSTCAYIVIFRVSAIFYQHNIARHIG